MGVTIKQREKSGYSVQSQAIMTYKRWIEKGQLPSEAGRGQAESVFFFLVFFSIKQVSEPRGQTVLMKSITSLVFLTGCNIENPLHPMQFLHFCIINSKTHLDSSHRQVSGHVNY